MGRLILTDTAIECVCRQAHSTHKVPACDVLRFPFPIELTELHPVDRDRLSACILALCLCNLNTLTLSLFELLTLQLRQGGKHGQHEFARRRVGVDILLVTDKRNSLVGQGVDDVKQVPWLF